jgi:hypothetical protein
MASGSAALGMILEKIASKDKGACSPPSKKTKKQNSFPKKTAPIEPRC